MEVVENVVCLFVISLVLCKTKQQVVPPAAFAQNES
jgi:hypothetical protein